jgi:hypothetical protein
MSGLYCFKILAIELALSTYSPLWQIDSKKSGIKSVYLLQQLLFQYRFHIFRRVIAVFCRFCATLPKVSVPTADSPLESENFDLETTELTLRGYRHDSN